MPNGVLVFDHFVVVVDKLVGPGSGCVKRCDGCRHEKGDGNAAERAGRHCGGLYGKSEIRNQNDQSNPNDETRNGIRFVILVWGSIGHSGFGFRIFCVLTISRGGSIIDCDG